MKTRELIFFARDVHVVIRTVLTTVTTAGSALQVIFFGEDHATQIVVVEIFSEF